MHSQPTTPACSDTGADAGESTDIKPSILLVEDEPTSRLMTSRQLTRAGYDVEVVSNGAEALAMLQKRFFPLLLTDWDMPEMDGVALCKAVRNMPLEGYVYTILLTAREGKANVIEGLASGADDYLTKPPDDHELRARLNTGRRILKLEQSLRAANRRNYLLSIRDPLTAAYNRRYLMERLPQEIERACRNGQPLSVVLCDLDHFKNVNDTYGHLAGDGVLKAFAELLLGSTRKDIDWVVRYGGEEFLIVMPETSAADAVAFAENIRVAIAAHACETPGGPARVSASFGVAGYLSVQAQDEVSVDSLIACADICLYNSKEAGRNRVTGKALGLGGCTIVVDRSA
jgi:two-component system, cell cycle response regulator